MELQKYPALVELRSSDIQPNTFLHGKPHPQPLSTGEGSTSHVADLGITAINEMRRLACT
jgi:hypothetical protein